MRPRETARGLRLGTRRWKSVCSGGTRFRGTICVPFDRPGAQGLLFREGRRMKPIRRIGISTGGRLPGTQRRHPGGRENGRQYARMGGRGDLRRVRRPHRHGQVEGPDAARDPGDPSAGGTILGTTNRGNPFKYQAEVRGKVVTRDLSPLVLRTRGNSGSTPW